MTTPLSVALPLVPADIADSLAREYAELEARYARSDWAPTSLNGGRFAEAVIRYLEWKQGGQFTAIGRPLNRERILNGVRSDATVDEGLRLHVLKCAELLLDVRNRRDVAHLGTDIDVNEMDSHLVLRLAAWSLSEIIRQEAGSEPNDRQKLMDKLTTRMIPLIEEIGGDLVVLSTALNARAKVLVVLYHAYPDPRSPLVLQKSAAYTNSSRFRSTVLGELGKSKFIHVTKDGVYLTRLGIGWVESHLSLQLDAKLP